MSQYPDLVGEKFGRLTVVGLLPERKRGNRVWLCSCECGTQTKVITGKLRDGSVKSCGCIRYEMKVKQLTIHGDSRTRLYRIWKQIHSRCYNPNVKNFDDYGGRGITMCTDWKNDFRKFRAWAETHGYSDTLSIDRIDNDGNYCPENCRWVNRIVQANNKRNNRIIEYNGETHTLPEWATIQGLTRNALWKRLYKEGWSVEKALTTPLTVRNRIKEEKQHG